MLLKIMMHKVFLFCTLFMLTFNLKSQNLISIIPEPMEIAQGSGFFVLDNNKKFELDSDSDLSNSINFYNDYV